MYTEIGDRFRELDSWSMYLITSYEDAEKYIGKKADKNRKIYRYAEDLLLSVPWTEAAEDEQTGETVNSWIRLYLQQEMKVK